MQRTKSLLEYLQEISGWVKDSENLTLPHLRPNPPDRSLDKSHDQHLTLKLVSWISLTIEMLYHFCLTVKLVSTQLSRLEKG